MSFMLVFTDPARTRLVREVSSPPQAQMFLDREAALRRYSEAGLYSGDRCLRSWERVGAESFWKPTAFPVVHGVLCEAESHAPARVIESPMEIDEMVTSESVLRVRELLTGFETSIDVREAILADCSDPLKSSTLVREISFDRGRAQGLLLALSLLGLD